MVPLVTAQQMRAVEAAEFESGASESELSDRAARAITQRLLRMPRDGNVVIVISGPGNNGLDGIKIHRMLTTAGVESKLHCWRRKDCAADLDLRRLRGDLQRASIVVDGLFGTGLTRDVEGEAAELLWAVSAERDRRRDGAPPLRIVAVDVPSGLQSDTGRVMGTALAVDATVTLGLPKVGLYTGAGPETAGDIWRESIGLNVEDLKAADAIGFDSTERLDLPPRKVGSHKNDNGRVLVLGGSLKYPGAPVLAALAAQRLGAGYVTVGFPRSLLGVVASRLLAETLLPLPESDVATLGPAALKDATEGAESYRSLVLGNGVGREQATVDFVLQLLGVSSQTLRRSVGFRREVHGASASEVAGSRLPPVVVDGDGLYALASQEEWWASTPAVALLTPHPGEMARLADCSVDDVDADRIGIAREAASRWGKTVLLKGSYPLVAAPDGKVEVLTEAHPELGSAGTGDVLAGICGYLLSLGLGAAIAARAALVLGARAARRASAAVGPNAVGASDLIDALPEARREDER